MDHAQRFKDLVAFLVSLRGDLMNVTAPPSFQAPSSGVELPTCWGQRPSLMVASTKESDPLQRSLRVLEHVLLSLKAQYYLGLDKEGSVRKPLNSFLGELFVGQWTDDAGTVEMIGEQVSHHPPITAAYLNCKEHGVSATGYARTGMTFSGALNVKFTGHIVLHLDEYNEDYLIPFPSCKMKGILSRKLYPELNGIYHIVSSTGFVSEITFSGESLFSDLSKRNRFTAKLYRTDDRSKTPLYVASGQWNKQFTVRDASSRSSTPVTHNVDVAPATLQIETRENQDPWESRRAWGPVIDAIDRGELFKLLREKTKLEEAQRKMRKKEAAEGTTWEPLFFKSQQDDDVAKALASAVGWKLRTDETKGIWRLDKQKVEKAQRPWRGEKTPYG